MTLRSIRGLFSFNRLCLNTNRRLFSVYNRVENNNNLIDYNTNSKSKKIVSLLREYEFSDRQIDSIFNSIGKYIIEEKELNERLMRDTIECWNSYLKPPLLRANQLDKMNAEDIDYDLTVDINHVISSIEPTLLLINANAIAFRINSIKQLPIIGGSRDLWRAFVYSPNGYYLQSWTDFLKKYHYLNFRVLEWLLDKKDRDNLHPHPLIRNARVMELPFDTIRSRYLFAKRTGLKTLGIKSSSGDMTKIDLKALCLTPIEMYLKLVAPNCTPEEFYALEALLIEMPAEEDEQIIEDMVELTTSQKQNFKKASVNQKDNERRVETNYEIITPID